MQRSRPFTPIAPGLRFTVRCALIDLCEHRIGCSTGRHRLRCSAARLCAAGVNFNDGFGAYRAPAEANA
jgi:hypothetical protein